MNQLTYLLDTNILSDLVRHPSGKITQKIKEVGENCVCTSIVVAAELRYGAYKKQSDRLAKQLEIILSALEVLPLEPPIDGKYAKLRVDLELKGTPIGPNDMLIAAHALAKDLILVTANVDEFARVSGLSIQNWLE